MNERQCTADALERMRLKQRLAEVEAKCEAFRQLTSSLTHLIEEGYKVRASWQRMLALKDIVEVARAKIHALAADKEAVT